MLLKVECQISHELLSSKLYHHYIFDWLLRMLYFYPLQTKLEQDHVHQPRNAPDRFVWLLHFTRNIWKNRGDIESAFHLPIDVRMPLHI